ncbi:MAG: hypothetical protein WB422_19280, partial [Pseudolabrys sp.]
SLGLPGLAGFGNEVTFWFLLLLKRRLFLPRARRFFFGFYGFTHALRGTTQTALTGAASAHNQKGLALRCGKPRKTVGHFV